VARVDEQTFRIVTIPLLVNHERIGSLYLATSLDADLARELDTLSGARIAVVSGHRVLATTLAPGAAAAFEAAAGSLKSDTIELSGESYAFQRLNALNDTSFYALGSIDEPVRAATEDMLTQLVLIGIGAGVLALVGSFSLARSLSTPIGHLSAALAHMAATHHVDGRLALSGSSRELDTLTQTFNDLMSSIAEAEDQTEAAYTGAIRALAAALDARDPYTAGHSERVSVVSVAIGRQLGLADEAVEVVRLGALLHDIGKIGISDEVLRKPGPLTPAEYDVIKQHPVLGARILRSVPFLAQHLPIVELHHERPDGRGYPYGLHGDDIPVAARIVHVADAYDAMTSARAYRRARPAGDALRELWRCAGTEFHAEIVGALATALPNLMSESSPAAAFETVGG
jgi:putative nucleotidyltransferase with HDIG domain